MTPILKFSLDSTSNSSDAICTCLDRYSGKSPLGTTSYNIFFDIKINKRPQSLRSDRVQIIPDKKEIIKMTPF